MGAHLSILNLPLQDDSIPEGQVKGPLGAGVLELFRQLGKDVSALRLGEVQCVVLIVQLRTVINAVIYRKAEAVTERDEYNDEQDDGERPSAKPRPVPCIHVGDVSARRTTACSEIGETCRTWEQGNYAVMTLPI